MSDIVEGLGAAVEGALASKAVEPRTGNAALDESAKAEPGSRTCANCGAHVTGKYCGNCGQKLAIHRTLSALGHDLIHGVLHLDGKLSRTLPLLTFKPGRLTRRYIEGERASFVSPMSMFLFSVFAMLAVFQLVGIGVPSDLGPLVDDENVAEMRETYDAMIERNTTLETEIDDMAEGAEPD